MANFWRLTAYVAAGLSFSAPAAAQSADGEWVCRRDGQLVGTLAVAGSTYAFGSAAANDPATGSGTLGTANGSLTVASGPLLDRLGLLSATVIQDSLAPALDFAGPQASLACLRR